MDSEATKYIYVCFFIYNLEEGFSWEGGHRRKERNIEMDTGEKISFERGKGHFFK